MNTSDLEPFSEKPAICVFCGASHGRDPAYAAAARRFGELLVENGFSLVFGGGRVGLMGEVAEGVSTKDGDILGIIPGFLRHLEPPLRVRSRIIVTDTLNARKTQMFAAAMGFAILPGGLGTLDEFFEAYTEAQLHQHRKPIVLVNIGGYFAPLTGLIDHMVREGFIDQESRDLLLIADTPEEAVRLFAAARDLG